jgi:hypothetical protein
MSSRLPPAVAQALTVLRWTAADARLVLDALAASGLTRAEFARTHAVSAQRLYVWQRRLAAAPAPRAAPDATAPLRFVELHGAPPTTPGPFRVEIAWPSGPVVRLAGPLDEASLRMIVRVLREAGPC